MPDELAGLLTRNLLEVFNERDEVKRLEVIRELYVEEAAFYEPDAVFIGVEKINDRVTEFLATVPPEFQFKVVGEPTRNHDVARMAWTLGPESGNVIASGQDVGVMQDGRIASLYVFIDAA